MHAPMLDPTRVHNDDGGCMSPSLYKSRNEHQNKLGAGRSKRPHVLSEKVTSDQSSIERMQKLLLILRHASKCPHLPEEDELDEGAKICPVYDHCASVKKLCKHISECKCNRAAGQNRDNKSCSYPNCNRSRFVLWHFKHCADPSLCPVCGPVQMVISREHEATKMTGKKDPKIEEESEQLRSYKRRRIEGGARDVNQSCEPIEPIALDEASGSSCIALLDTMMNSENGWVFDSPVDPELLKIPDYFDVIEHPMDLGTVRDRVCKGYYLNLTSFRDDVILTFDNAISYNLLGSEVHNMAVQMKSDFLSMYQQVFS